MKTPKGTLSPRQEELMLFLWDKDVSLTENNFLEVKGLEKAVKTYARKLAPSMTRAEYYGNLLASRGITKEDLPQIIASVIGTEKDSVEQEIDEMLQRL